MKLKIFIIFGIWCYAGILSAQTPQPLKQLLKADYMKGASIGFIAKEVETGEILYAYDIDRELTPASILKTVTTATALEILGADYRYPTIIEYDGKIENGVLNGNLYIKGSGDPSLGSAHLTADRANYRLEHNTFIPQWIKAVKEAGIQKINGSVIADEGIFDTEGISPKWLQEDIGNYYGAGSYGLNVFDNLFHLYLQTGEPGEQPTIIRKEPEIPLLKLHNYLVSAKVSTDSAFITGGPYSNNRYMYGIVPANRNPYILKGDIPDPPLFLATYFKDRLLLENISIENPVTTTRLLKGKNGSMGSNRKTLITTYSPPIQELVRITNERSHNLYADALFKTVGLSYAPRPGEIISCFGKGVKIVQSFWKNKGIDPSQLNIYDGSGLAATDKVSASFMADMLCYMATRSNVSQFFIQSLPKAGEEGTVRNFLKGTPLQGNALLKSGGMSRVKSYAGYITKEGKQYAVVVIVNNYNCEGRVMTRALERLLTALF